MPTPSQRDLDSELALALREHGQRVTLPRLLVHRHVRRHGGHLTAEGLHSELSEELPSLSPATVYATLGLLEGLGLVRRVSTTGGAAVFDARVTEHHHMACRRCGRLEDVEASVDTEPARRRARRSGFSPEGAQVLITGLCADCAGRPCHPIRRC
ncbi:MAG: Fur family transcriptional regulator [Thermoleophilaceae bacterium]